MECCGLKALCSSTALIPRVAVSREMRPQIRNTTRAQFSTFRVRRMRVSQTRIFSESQTSPTTTKKRVSGPPMTPPKDPNEGGGGGGGWGGNVARNVALNLGFLGIWMFLDSTGGGGGFFNGRGNFGGGGGGGGGSGGSGGSGGAPSEPTFQVRELGDSDDEEFETKKPKRQRVKTSKRRKRLSVA